MTERKSLMGGTNYEKMIEYRINAFERKDQFLMFFVLILEFTHSTMKKKNLKIKWTQPPEPVEL